MFKKLPAVKWVLIPALFIVGACQTQPAPTEDAEAPPPAPAATDAPAATEAPAPTEAMEEPEPVTFVYAVNGLPTTVDIDPYQGDPTRYVRFPIGSGLVTYDPEILRSEGCDRLVALDEVAGELAESWTTSADGTTITFTLRDALSPFGNTLTTEDVKWSFDRAIEISGVSRSTFYTVANYEEEPINVIDDKTFELRMTQPNTLGLIASSGLSQTIFDSTEAKNHATADDPWATDWLATNTADFGPWQLASLDEEKAVFDRNPNYWGETGNIDQFIVLNVPEAAQRAQLLQAGTVDWISRPTFEDFTNLEQLADISTERCVAPDRDILLLNQADEIMADPLVREAISLSIDREALVQGAYRGFAKPAVSAVSQNFEFPAPDTTYAYDPERAMELLTEAGYPDGFTMTLVYSAVRPGPWVEQTAILIQDMLSEVGITVHLRNAPSVSELNGLFYGGQYQAVLWSEAPAPVDPAYGSAIYVLYPIINSFGYEGADFFSLAQQGMLTDFGPDRDALVSQMASKGVEDYGILYLTDKQYLNAYRANIDGFAPQPFGDLIPHYLTKGE
jgi:peptide/nickel transport system substrate-binding protein